MELQRPEAGGALFLSGKPISLSFGLCARIHGPLALGQLERALVALTRRHPLLAVRAFARPDGTPCFGTEGVPPIPVRIVERRADDDWVREVQREIQLPSDYSRGPLLRCIWLGDGDVSDIVLVCDHLTADGKAAVFALRDLLAFLAEPGKDVEPLIAPPLNELVPPELIPLIVADATALPDLQQAASAQSEEARADAALTLGEVRVTPFSLTVDETTALARRSREEGVTVQAALCAAFLTPFAERHPDRPVRRAEIPVDLRGRISRPVGDAYSCIIGLTEIDFDCTPGRNLWDVARDARAELAAIRDQDVFATPLVVISLTGRVPNRPWAIGYDVSISNIGRLDIPETYGERRLEWVYGPIFPATGPDHLILGVSTFAGAMRCTFNARGDGAAPLLARGRELLRQMAERGRLL